MIPFVSIGGVLIEQSAALAPMASVANRAYRVICKEFGASYVVGELASAKALCYADRKSEKLLGVTDQEMPMAVQLFGEDPVCMAKAAVIAQKHHPAIIDINMGCPVPKVVGNGSGSALMKTPALAYSIVKEVVNAVDLPVTVKIRKGWDEEHINAVEFACLMEQAGAAAITVHGRTKQQMYRPPVDLSIIRQVKEAVRIPVIGNGGIDSIDSAVQMYEQTGCDLVMIGQATYGNPWLFAQIRQYLLTGERIPFPDFEQRMEILLKQARLICEQDGEENGMRQARKHAAWYLKGLPGAAKFRHACGSLTTYADLLALVETVAAENNARI